jgi:hypothetical protein
LTLLDCISSDHRLWSPDPRIPQNRIPLARNDSPRVDLWWLRVLPALEAALGHRGSVGGASILARGVQPIITKIGGRSSRLPAGLCSDWRVRRWVVAGCDAGTGARCTGLERRHGWAVSAGPTAARPAPAPALPSAVEGMRGIRRLRKPRERGAFGAVAARPGPPLPRGRKWRFVVAVDHPGSHLDGGCLWRQSVEA